jgi:5,10-methenyltetrahydrofolate synthetase
MQDKAALRTLLLARRKALSPSEWQTRSDTIVASVKAYCGAKALGAGSLSAGSLSAGSLSAGSLRAVALYAPIVERREVDVSALDAWFRKLGVAVAYPVLSGKLRGFAFTTSSTMSRLAGFPQPSASSQLLEPGQLDLIIVPAVGVDKAGYRLGYGSGFYDEQLRKFCPPATSVCVAFAEQVLSDLPVEAHDTPCNFLITG